MEGDKILQRILKGEPRQLQILQNHIAPFQKFLDSDQGNKGGTKEVDQVVIKYGIFCMKLLRYCIEVLQKKQGIVTEECFKYSQLGADILSKLLTSGINLPTDISLTAIVKLLFHLIISALKQSHFVYLTHFTDCLISIIGGTKLDKKSNSSKDTTNLSKKTSDNLSKDTTSICKQISDHLWNAAIKLEQSVLLEKHERSILALCIRRNSIFLLSVTKGDLRLIIERGLKSARQFQFNSSEEDHAEQLQLFLFGLLNTAINFIASQSSCLKDDDYNYLEDVCINCYKSAVSAEHFMELQELLSRLTKDSNIIQGRSSVFQNVLQLLQCSLVFRVKNVKIDNQKIKDDTKWNTLKKRLVHITENVKKLDLNICRESRITQALDCLRTSCNKFFTKKTEDQGCSDNTPQEILSSLVNLFLVCFEKLNKQSLPQTSNNSWKQTVLSELRMLDLISFLILEATHNGLEKFLQNGRKNSFKSDYVKAMLAGKTLLDELVEKVPGAAEHYGYLATDAFNVGLIFFKNNHVNEATSLARLSCNTANAWCKTRPGTINILHEALLFKKYELLSDCLDKQNKWKESLYTMTYCCQMYVLSSPEFTENSSSDAKALEYVNKWTTRKYNVIKQFNKELEVLQIKKSTLYDGWEQLEESESHEKEICVLLKMELDSYRKKGFCTDNEEFVVEKLLNIFYKNNDILNVCAMELEKVKVMQQMKRNVDYSLCLETCQRIIKDVKELAEQDSVVVQNMLALSYFWCFILQYSMSVNQSYYNKYRKESETDEEENVVSCNDSEVISITLFPDFLVSLQSAVNTWTQMIGNIKVLQDLDVISKNEMCWNLQITSSVCGFLNMPLAQIHTLNVLTIVAQTFGGNENLQTVVVARSVVIHILCEEGNIQSAELLVNECETILEKLANDCRSVTKYLFFIAKSYLFLLKGMYDDGWQLLNHVLQEVKNCKKAVFQLVLLKAKLLAWKYLSLPPSTWKMPIKDLSYIHLEFLIDSWKRAEALVDYLVGGNVDEMTNVVINNQPKEQYGILLSHWSVLSELLHCLQEIGKVFLIQGNVREASSYLEDGRNIAGNFLSPIRLSQFTIHLAELNFFKCEMETYEMYLNQVLRLLKPESTLFDIVEISKPLDIPVESLFSDDQSSFAKLHLEFLLCLCQYLRKMERFSDVNAIILSLRDLHKTSIERNEMVLKYQDEVYKQEEDYSNHVKLQHNSSKKNTKTKGKRGKTNSTLNEAKTEIISGNSKMARITFLKLSLKILALESDVALSNGDYITLLSRFQESLEIVKSSEEIIKSSVLQDLISISHLYYLRGVAHVLSSSGFDSWHVAGSPATLDCRRQDDLSETISGNVSKILTWDDDQIDNSLTKKLMKEPWETTEFIHDHDVGVKNNSRARTSVRPRSQTGVKCNSEISKKSESVVRSCKTTTRKKSSKKKLNIDEEVVREQEQDIEDKVSKTTRKSGRSTKKNNGQAKETLKKSSAKTKRNISRENKVFSASKNTSSLNSYVVESEKSEIPDEIQNDREKNRISNRLSCNSDICNQNKGTSSGSILKQDEEIVKALHCFHISLKYLHPCYNPVLFSRISHAFVLCYGLQSPENAAIYHNLPLATTLRHQALVSSAKKIRKIKDELSADEIEDCNQDELMTLYESISPDDNRKTKLEKLLHLKTVQNTIGFKIFNEELAKCFEEFIDLLPYDWTVCTLSIIFSPENDNLKYLVVTRLRKEEKPVVLKLKLPGNDDEDDSFQSGQSIARDLFAASRTKILSDFTSVFQESRESMSVKNTHDWWKKRMEIDEQLQRVLQRLEDIWFGKWRGILSGCMTKNEDIKKFKSNIKDIQEKASEIFGVEIENEQLLELLVEWYPLLKQTEVVSGIAELTRMKENSVQVIKFCKALEQVFARSEDRHNTTSLSRGPVVLILDKTIQHLPFESMPVLREQEVSRMPSLDFVTSHLTLQTIKTAPVHDVLTSGVDTQKTFYVLNPKKDLKKTEKTFHEWFSTEEGWHGVVGRAPTNIEVKEALTSRHLYLYLGHGTGREFFKGDEVQRLYCQAVTILMGCSSGKLIVQGDCDARGMVLNYLLSGCPAVVANLWDVTDKDIDRFSSALFKSWLKKDNKLSLSQCVTQCRKACVLKYLIGSAPVIYGMPVYTRP